MSQPTLRSLNNEITRLKKIKTKHPYDAKDIFEGTEKFKVNYDCDMRISELEEKVERLSNELNGQS